MRRIVFRVDASTEMGTGHVMRCLTLAQAFCERGDTAAFVCREHPGNLCDIIERHGYIVLRLPLANPGSEGDKSSMDPYVLGTAWDVDAAQTVAAIASLRAKPAWLVVDHYAIDNRWEEALRPWVDRIMVIDDLGNRPHDCEILLDQNLHEHGEALYQGRLATSTRRFIGPKFAVLRPEFDEPNLLRVRDGLIRRLLVFFGGTDPGNQCARVMRGLAMLGEFAPDTTIVLGPTNPNRDEVLVAAMGMPRVTVFVSTDRMAELIAEADLGIGTCGVAAWERCALGLPSLVTVSAENQREDARMLHALGACQNLGDAFAITETAWMNAIRSLCCRHEDVARMAVASLRVLDGRHQAYAALQEALGHDWR